MFEVRDVKSMTQSAVACPAAMPELVAETGAAHSSPGPPPLRGSIQS
jgi:hypothetical protein